ncbi:DUF418 domain-containing protein [Paraliobacillus ryukyuensis]|uniref:DUF418 domain-containing protein n=1 Tax=Paraliobacillus ryukyuensis TaxID=200904 RepID=UPI00277B57B0|nr:DUF418 domain-containing protein [Paraliobacillus ryukyuensis]
MMRIEQAITNYSSGSLLTIWQQNFIDWTASNGVFSYILLTCNLLPLFLFGMVTARKRWLHEVEHHKVLIQKIWFVSLIIFIVVKAGVYFWDNHTWLSMFQDTIGGSASAIFYLTSITLLFQKSPFTRLLKPFTYVGKMSLSNYIFQSVSCFILFYGVGFGLYNTINPVGSLMIVLVIYLCQVVLSRWYMTYYRFGPIEWVWRRLMYMEKLPNKRQPK